MGSFVAAIDQGTTSTRIILFDAPARRWRWRSVSTRQVYPQPGWVEHDATEILDNTRGVIAEALRGAGLSARDLAAVGLPNQRETTVL